LVSALTFPREWLSPPDYFEGEGGYNCGDYFAKVKPVVVREKNEPQWV
jgi:hypothetical protein